jgi:hypothetical protein
VQGTLTKCGVSECDREASIMRRPSRGCCAMEVEENEIFRKTKKCPHSEKLACSRRLATKGR